MHHKEQFDFQVDYWKSKLLTWESKHDEKKRLTRRLHREVENHDQEYRNLFEKLSDIIKDGDTEQIFENDECKDDQPEGEENLNDAVIDFEELREKRGTKHLKEPNDEKEGELHVLVTKLEHQIEELNGRIDFMYKSNQIVGRNMDRLTQENSTLKDQNKCLQDANNEHEKVKDNLELKI